MHERLAEIMDYLERKREELLRSFAGVSPEPMRRRVSDEAWSVAEIIDHLRLVETSVAQLLSKRARDARAKGIGDEQSTVSVLDSLDHLAIEADNTFMEAPSIVRPRPYVDVGDAIVGLDESRNALRAAATSASGLALGEIRQKHYAFGELDLYQWLVFMGQHEGRHTRQILRTLNATRAGDAALTHR
ncbi:MAG: DinB family protein [Gemmatimonadota bacterium]|nr:DinB family protein [Gemmatimonadota bacterium]